MSDAHRDQVRRRLIDATRRCIERDGPGALSTRAVVAEAGLSMGTLYHHFPSVDHLVAAVAEEEMRSGIARVAAAAPAGDGDGPLVWLLRAVVGDVALAATVAGLRTRVEAGADGAVAGHRLQRMVAATVGEAVDQARATGAVAPEVDRDALVELIDLVWDGIGRRHARGLVRTSPERVAAVAADVLGRGCRGHPAG